MSKSDFFPFVYHTKNLSKNNRQPRVTVVGSVDESGKTLCLSVARCSKNDQFTKKVGRQIAAERLQKGEFVAQVPINEPSLTNFIACAVAVGDAAIKYGVHHKIAISLVPQPMKAQYKLV